MVSVVSGVSARHIRAVRGKAVRQRRLTALMPKYVRGRPPGLPVYYVAPKDWILAYARMTELPHLMLSGVEAWDDGRCGHLPGTR